MGRVLAGGEGGAHESGRQALPTFVMCVFKLPDGLCEDLTKMIRDFWWGAIQGQRRTHWVSWDIMLKAKSHGGMGFRDMKIFNQALLAKQASRLIENPQSLCAQVLKAKYYPNGLLVDTVFTGNASSTWQAIEYGLELLKKGIIWRIGSVPGLDHDTDKDDPMVAFPALWSVPTLVPVPLALTLR